MKFTFVKSQILDGIPFAFYHPGLAKVYVSPALFKLCSGSDLGNLRDHLKVRVLKQVDGQYPFETIEQWVQYLKDKGEL